MKRPIIRIAVGMTIVVVTLIVLLFILDRKCETPHPIAYVNGPEYTVYGLYANWRGDLWLSERDQPEASIAATNDYYEDFKVVDAEWHTDTDLLVKTQAGVVFQISVSQHTLEVQYDKLQPALNTRWDEITVVPTITYRQGDVEPPDDEPVQVKQVLEKSADSGTESREDTDSDTPRAAPSIDELFLFFPDKHPAGDWNPVGLKFEDLWCAAEDKTRIHGWYCPCDNPRATVLIAHGNAQNIAYRAPWLRYLQTNMRVATYMFDYRGYGRSEGVPTVEGTLQDARAARACLAQRAGIQESELVLMGESLGGAIVVQLAAESAPRALILQSTFSSFKDVADVHYPQVSFLVPPAKLDSATQIGRFHGPLLQSHGTADSVIPFSLGERLFQSANEPKTFVPIPGGDHNNSLTDDYLREVDAFLTRIGNDAKTTPD